MATPGKKTRNAGPEKSSEHMHEVEEPKMFATIAAIITAMAANARPR